MRTRLLGFIGAVAMIRTKTARSRQVWILLAGAVVFYLAGFMFAAEPQGSAQSTTPPPPQTTAPGAPASGAPSGQRARGRGAQTGDGAGRSADPFEGAELSPKDPIRPQSVADELKSFLLPPGYRMEPVIAEPDVEEPMQIAFDGNGRMFVLENRGYMQDADANGELDPVGRISVHEDVNNDGVYEKHTIFVANLVFPRFVTPVGPGSVLAMESNTDDVYRYTDTDGDWVADKKELFTSSFGRSGNVEHQQASLFWAMDNWLYSTYNTFRVRWNGSSREPTAANNAQWGITQDSFGKVWFQGGASGLPGFFQLPIHYGLGLGNSRGFMEPGFDIPWGVAGLGDYQPGTSAIRPGELTLGSVTGSAGNDVYRGDRLPADLVGDYIYGEPVARIVRRVRPVSAEGLTTLRQVYQWQHSEFIRSSDHLFRPVDIATAPDGTLYIVDTYRGIIQEGNWTRPGSYLRAKLDQYQLDKIVRHGRIWRVTYEGMDRDRTQPRMHDETPAQLVSRLGHANGWWRDTAQQLLVLRQDKSVVPALQKTAQSSTNLFGRIHAIWTLEGLGALDATLVRQLMTDPHPQIRIQAMRAGETLVKAGNRSLLDDVRARTKDSDTDVVVQSMLTLHLFKVPDLGDLVRAAQGSNKGRGVQLVGTQITAPPPPAFGRGGRGGSSSLSAEDIATMERGDVIYKELCFACHGSDGRGAQKVGAPDGTVMAPSLVGSLRVLGHRDYVIKALLHGLTGPVAGQTYSEVMVPQGSNKDEWIAAIASYVRNMFGNTAAFVTPADVAKVRAATASRKTMWTFEELDASVPRQLIVQPTWKATASHNPDLAGNGLNFVGWSTGKSQEPGMWYQVELPEPAMVAEIQFQSTTGGRGGIPTGAFSMTGPVPGARLGGEGQAPPAGARAGGTPAGAETPAPPRTGFPIGYKVQVSMDGTTWSAPVAEGKGAAGTTTIPFVPVRARFVRITQTTVAPDALPWSILRLRIFVS